MQGQFICCDTTALSSSNQFQIPFSSYIFGVRIHLDNVRLSVFVPSAVEFRAEQFQTTATGNSFTLGVEDRVTDHSILLLRFLIG